MSAVFSLTRAGRWFLESGIQEPSGGVARFYRSEIGKNKPVSTEITGYTASALIYLFEVTGDQIYLDRARQTARFLLHHAWDSTCGPFPSSTHRLRRRAIITLTFSIAASSYGP